MEADLEYFVCDMKIELLSMIIILCRWKIVMQRCTCLLVKVLKHNLNTESRRAIRYSAVR